MDNHGYKGCLHLPFCITYPPNSISFRRSFLFFLPFQLNKIKVGGDSCYPHISLKSVHRISKWFTNGCASQIICVSMKKKYKEYEAKVKAANLFERHPLKFSTSFL